MRILVNVPDTLTEEDGFRDPARWNRKAAIGARPPVNLPYLGRGTVALIPGAHIDDADELSRCVSGLACRALQCELLGVLFLR